MSSKKLMQESESKEKWQRLSRLLEPAHARAIGTARRLSGHIDRGDDLYQEAVLRAFDKLDTLNDETRFAGWFFAVLLSVHRSRCRKSFWRRFVSMESACNDVRELRTQGALSEEDYWSSKRALRALDALPCKQREAVVLFEIEGFSIEEVAEMQNAEIPAVKSRLCRGRAKLRRRYEKMGWFQRSAGGFAIAAEFPEGESS